MTEDEIWQTIMHSCRRAIKIINARERTHIDFKEPEYLNWKVGSAYQDGLWDRVNSYKKTATGGSTMANSKSEAKQLGAVMLITTVIVAGAALVMKVFGMKT